MATRFKPGGAAFTKDGRRYIVDEVVNGTVYCASSAGAETEFAENQLLTEAEWSAKTGGLQGMVYSRLKQAACYAPVRSRLLDRSSAERLLQRAETLFPGLLDFAAFCTATRVIAETASSGSNENLSIVRCREIFDETTAETRATLLSAAIGTIPDRLVSAAGLGDNLLRAMIDKGLAENLHSFDAFRTRPRR
jgi:hypothetical protein